MITLDLCSHLRVGLNHSALALAIFGLSDGTLTAADNVGTGGTIT